MKREFDKRHLDFAATGAFQCIAGRHFASTRLRLALPLALSCGAGHALTASCPAIHRCWPCHDHHHKVVDIFKQCHILKECCPVGAVSHETQQFIHLLVDTLHIVLFKSRDLPDVFID